MSGESFFASGLAGGDQTFPKQAPCEVCAEPAQWLITRCTASHVHILCMPCTHDHLHQHAPRMIKCPKNLTEAEAAFITLRKKDRP